mmetsp:Transcript_14597/g.43856  ORF Transcript_14597/g.43856 Transcript_14597/m.43856 type:complete len:342 (-) Transcript_14597:1149-2174(-)
MRTARVRLSPRRAAPQPSSRCRSPEVSVRIAGSPLRAGHAAADGPKRQLSRRHPPPVLLTRSARCPTPQPRSPPSLSAAPPPPPPRRRLAFPCCRSRFPPANHRKLAPLARRLGQCLPPPLQVRPWHRLLRPLSGLLAKRAAAVVVHSVFVSGSTSRSWIHSQNPRPCPPPSRRHARGVPPLPWRAIASRPSDAKPTHSRRPQVRAAVFCPLAVPRGSVHSLRARRRVLPPCWPRCRAITRSGRHRRSTSAPAVARHAIHWSLPARPPRRISGSTVRRPLPGRIRGRLLRMKKKPPSRPIPALSTPVATGRRTAQLRRACVPGTRSQVFPTASVTSTATAI